MGPRGDRGGVVQNVERGNWNGTENEERRVSFLLLNGRDEGLIHCSALLFDVPSGFSFCLLCAKGGGGARYLVG